VVCALNKITLLQVRNGESYANVIFHYTCMREQESEVNMQLGILKVFHFSLFYWNEKYPSYEYIDV